MAEHSQCGRRLARAELACVLLFPVSLIAQSLQLTKATAAPGEWAIIEIGLALSPEKELLDLQWEMSLPAKQLILESQRMIRVSLAVKDAGKVLRCTVLRGTPETQTYRCVLFGGQKPLQAGSLALISLKVLENAPAGPSRVLFENVMAVNREVHPVALDPVETVVTIRGK